MRATPPYRWLLGFLYSALVALVLLSAISCNSSSKEAESYKMYIPKANWPENIKLSKEFLNASSIVLDIDCSTGAPDQYHYKVTIPKKDLTIYKQVVDDYAGGMGCPCDLSLCIEGVQPTKDLLAFLNSGSQVTWQVPTRQTGVDVSLSRVAWTDDNRARLNLQTGDKEYVYIVLLAR